MRARRIPLTLLALLWAGPAPAGLLLNEILYDPPGPEPHPSGIAPVGAKRLRIDGVHASVSSARQLRPLMGRLSPRRKPWSCQAAKNSMTERVLILDVGSQYARRIGTRPEACRRS